MLRRSSIAVLSLCSSLVAAGAAPCAALLLSSAGVAHASSDEWQITDNSAGMWGGGMMNLWEGPQLALSQRHLARIGDVLGLDDDQRIDLENLYFALEEQHLEAWVEFAEGTNDANNVSYTGDYDWEEMQKEAEARTESFMQRQDDLIALLFEDLQLIITPQQLERWPLVEMEQRRQRMLGKYGCYPKERFDLIAAVNTLDLEDAEREALEPVLIRYAKEIDPLLQARHKALENIDKQNEGVSEEQMNFYDLDWESDPEGAQAAYEKAMERMNDLQQDVVRAALAARPACKRVHDLNERYLDEIKPMLDARGRAELERLTADKASDDGMTWNPLDYSRSKQMMSFLLNMEEMLVAWGAYMDSTDDDSGMGMMRLARNVEPLRPEQVMQLEEMLEELEAERELLRLEAPESMMPSIAEAQDNSFTITTPGGSYSLYRADEDAEQQMMVMWDSEPSAEDQAEAKRVEAFQEKQSKMEQRYIDRIRSILTLRQRALIAFQ